MCFRISAIECPVRTLIKINVIRVAWLEFRRGADDRRLRPVGALLVAFLTVVVPARGSLIPVLRFSSYALEVIPRLGGRNKEGVTTLASEAALVPPRRCETYVWNGCDILKRRYLSTETAFTPPNGFFLFSQGFLSIS